MPKLFQINQCLNLSTGRIAQQIGERAKGAGWECWIAYSGRESYRLSKLNIIKVGNYCDTILHYVSQKMFDNEGLRSGFYTKQLIKQIDAIKPDIVHLHNIHDHWLNYRMLFEYLVKLDVPVVWTQHDCWSFTGGCMYFDMLGCEKWKQGCMSCPDNRALFNRSERNYKLKESLLSKIRSLTFVPVSDWLADIMMQSAQKNRNIITIHNGTDISTFCPPNVDGGSCKRTESCQSGKSLILGVAAVWNERKGLDDFVKLRGILPEEYEIMLVGLTQDQIDKLPAGMRGIQRTDNVQALVKLYCEAEVFVNPTYSDNFPTTNIEALSCGTPVITYKTGGSPEAIDDKTGVVIEIGDIKGIANAIMNMHSKPLSPTACRERAVQYFDKNKCFDKYIRLYNELMNK